MATVNRALVTLRRFFGWLVERACIPTNPAKAVKELRRQQLAPKGLDRAQVRRLLREIELRQDVRAGAIFSLFLYTGCRVSDLVALELHDVMMGERSGSVVFRYGKGGKQRSVPLPLPARRALQAYLESRPPVGNNRVFVGERGPLTERGVRALCDKYSASDWREAAPAPAQAHDGASISHGQWERLGGVGANPGPRKLEHDGQIHETDGGAVGRGEREVGVLRDGVGVTEACHIALPGTSGLRAFVSANQGRMSEGWGAAPSAAPEPTAAHPQAGGYSSDPAGIFCDHVRQR